MLTLYHHPFSPSSRFVRLILGEYGANYEMHTLNPWERRREFLMLNPAGTVPVLVENGGTPVCGPYAIMEYLDETRGYAMGDRRLMPDHPELRAETRRLVEWGLRKFDDEVVGHFVRERIYKQDMPRSVGAVSRIRPFSAWRAPIFTIICAISAILRLHANGWAVTG